MRTLSSVGLVYRIVTLTLVAPVPPVWATFGHLVVAQGVVPSGPKQANAGVSSGAGVV